MGRTACRRRARAAGGSRGRSYGRQPAPDPVLGTSRLPCYGVCPPLYLGAGAVPSPLPSVLVRQRPESGPRSAVSGRRRPTAVPLDIRLPPALVQGVQGRGLMEECVRVKLAWAKGLLRLIRPLAPTAPLPSGKRRQEVGMRLQHPVQRCISRLLILDSRIQIDCLAGKLPVSGNRGLSYKLMHVGELADDFRQRRRQFRKRLGFQLAAANSDRHLNNSFRRQLLNRMAIGDVQNVQTPVASRGERQGETNRMLPAAVSEDAGVLGVERACGDCPKLLEPKAAFSGRAVIRRLLGIPDSRLYGQILGMMIDSPPPPPPPYCPSQRFMTSSSRCRSSSKPLQSPCSTKLLSSGSRSAPLCLSFMESTQAKWFRPPVTMSTSCGFLPIRPGSKP
ncbi:hypothetical protein BN871_EM_00100 [Paenibacillus sp. P22]|nr:hypothetical protein BN871_EM_00100 [Paenibacillus sp. P22]